MPPVPYASGNDADAGFFGTKPVFRPAAGTGKKPGEISADLFTDDCDDRSGTGMPGLLPADISPGGLVWTGTDVPGAVLGMDYAAGPVFQVAADDLPAD